MNSNLDLSFKKNYFSDYPKDKISLAVSVPLAISIIIHIALVLSLTKDTPPIQNSYKAINVDISQMFKNKKQQVVNPSDINNQEMPKDESFLSDNNNVAKEQIINRGDGGNNGKAQEDKPFIQKAVKNNSNKTISQEQNKLDSGSKKEQTQAYNNIANALGAIGTRGSPDAISNIKDGDITLLNTKASKHAVFVRRVAIQVFNKLKASSWNSLSYREIKNLNIPALVTAILNKDGSLKKVIINKESNSNRFNNTIKEAVKYGANDPHPPISALATDGKFHFVFQSQITSKLYSRQNGAQYEKRWLSLSVGLL